VGTQADGQTGEPGQRADGEARHPDHPWIAQREETLARPEPLRNTRRSAFDCEHDYTPLQGLRSARRRTNPERLHAASVPNATVVGQRVDCRSAQRHTLTLAQRAASWIGPDRSTRSAGRPARWTRKPFPVRRKRRSVAWRLVVPMPGMSAATAPAARGVRSPFSAGASSGSLSGASSDQRGKSMVGVRGFEPPTPCSQNRCATGLRYTPKLVFTSS
jgi:hypothetical protein